MFMTANKDKFPLHALVWQQCASAITTEANVEQDFSMSKRISDPNMLPPTLQCFTFITANKKQYPLTDDEIFERYKTNYHNKGSHFGVDGLGLEDDSEPAAKGAKG